MDFILWTRSRERAVRTPQKLIENLFIEAAALSRFLQLSVFIRTSSTLHEWFLSHCEYGVLTKQHNCWMPQMVHTLCILFFLGEA